MSESYTYLELACDVLVGHNMIENPKSFTGHLCENDGEEYTIFVAKGNFSSPMEIGCADGWISVHDYLPQVDFEVLVASDDDVMTSIFREGFVQGDWWFDCEVGEKWRVSHWMPLPNPPVRK